MFVSDKGAEYPILRDDGVLRNDCPVLQGGVKKPGSPIFTPVVANEGDLLWRDDDLVLVQENTGEVILVDDNF